MTTESKRAPDVTDLGQIHTELGALTRRALATDATVSLDHFDEARIHRGATKVRAEVETLVDELLDIILRLSLELDASLGTAKGALTNLEPIEEDVRRQGEELRSCRRSRPVETIDTTQAARESVIDKCLLLEQAVGRAVGRPSGLTATRRWVRSLRRHRERSRNRVAERLSTALATQGSVVDVVRRAGRQFARDVRDLPSNWLHPLERDALDSLCARYVRLLSQPDSPRREALAEQLQVDFARLARVLRHEAAATEIDAA